LHHLSCDHTELYVAPEEAMAVIPSLPSLYDEPFGDSSQIPTYLVSKLARRHVTVSLSGDAGDELFAGYTRYQWANAIWRTMGWAPVPFRQGFSRVLNTCSHRVWDKLIFPLIAPLFPKGARQTKPADKLEKLAQIMTARSADALYLRLVSQWPDPASVVPGSLEPPTLLTQPDRWAPLPDFTRRMMYLDTLTYLPDDILAKLDRASMGVSLESRVPFLDHRVIEFSWRLPLGMKFRKGDTKWLLKQVLAKYVPRRLTDRPKLGFGIPIHEWLRGPLRGWAEEYLDAGRLRREGFFDPAPISQYWAEHLSGKHNHMYPLWNVLMFQTWLEQERSSGFEVTDVVAAYTA
jgi:asparagine synthase (glutamine-hydrolysing)